MIEVIPYEASHLFELMDRGILECCVSNCSYNIELAKNREDDIGSVTAVLDSEILACAGAKHLWPGVGDLWALFSPEVDNHKIEIARLTKKVLDDIMELGKFHRIQCHVKSNYYRGLRLAQFLGFDEEGLARKYTVNGEDCYLFSIVR